MSCTVAPDRLGTVLGVWAHPDDEAYLSAGLMALARRAGQRVVVVTATAGEHGTPDPDRWPPEVLAPHRRTEMAASLAATGVVEHHWLGYRDGGCELVPDARAVATIGAVIETVRPDTIVTFGPEGMTGHPDHRAVSSWTTAAWRERRPRARLWYATLLSSFHRRWGALNDDVGLFAEVVPPDTPDVEAAAVVHCDGWLLDRKQAALRAHASQVQPLVDLVGEETFRSWWAVEAFADASTVLTGVAS